MRTYSAGEGLCIEAPYLIMLFLLQPFRYNFFEFENGRPLRNTQVSTGVYRNT